MKKEFLEQCIAEGLTLREIGERTGKHLSTVGYWMKRYGLRTAGSEKFKPKRSEISQERLERLVDSGASLRKLAQVLGLSVSAVRHWLTKYDLETSQTGWRRAQARMALKEGLPEIQRSCPHHGITTYRLEGRGYYRCLKCRSQHVSEWRRRVKRRLIAAAGGSCVMCGYDACPAALHFHHLEPANKSFAISREGVTRAYAEVKAEAAKCVLLCANCHAEVEDGYMALVN